MKKSKWTKLLILVFSVMVTATTMPANVFAETSESVQYVDRSNVTSGEIKECSDYTLMSNVGDDEWRTALKSGWYVVDRNTTFNKRVYVDGTVNIILTKNTTLTCKKGINVDAGHTLNIYGQIQAVSSLDGKLEATGDTENNAGIGSYSANAGNVNIHGGNITATGGDGAAGIGGGDGADGGEVTIYGGKVTANGGYRAAGIGGGVNGSNTKVTIRGGEVHAYGGGVKNVGTRQSGGAGIGGGAYGYGGVIFIRGGDVEAKGVWGGAGLGGGYGCSVTTVAISGDDTKVSANADKGAAAIGGGCGGDAYNIGIDGGTVNAEIITPESGVAGAAIGSGDSGYVANIAITGGTVKAMSEFGNNGAAAIGGGNKGYFGNIRIEGGDVTAVQAYGGAGIGSGSESKKGSDQATAKITISGGTIRSDAVTAYSYHSTGAGIGSGSYADDYSPVNIEISGGNINAYCAMDDGSDKKLDYSGAGIGSGYSSPIGTITISGGTILASRGKGCTKADPIGYYDDVQNSVYQNITLNYDKAQIRNEKGEGSDKRVKNTQYDESANLSRRLALLENDSDWVEIKPCDHVGASYEIVSAGEDGKHKLNCDYCLSGNDEEQVHKFDDSNKCECGYYRFKLTFKDGQEGGKSTTAYVYPDLKDGEVETEKEITISDYMPNPMFKVAGKELDGWTIQGDDSGYVYKNEYLYKVKSDTTFVAQWNDLAGVKIVLSSIDGPVAQMRLENMFSESARISDVLGDENVKTGLNALINKQGDAYIIEKDLAGRPKYWASKPLSSFTSIADFQSDLDVNATIKDLGDSQIFYVAAFKPINVVELSIKAPLCGTKTEVSEEKSTNPPEFTALEGAGYSVNKDPYSLLWLKGTQADDVFEGTIRGGTDYYVLGVGVISADYGYAFKDDTGVALDGGVVEGKAVNGQYLTVAAKVKAVHDFDDKWETVTPATCTDKGTEQRKCKADGCDETESRETDIDENAHDYGEPTYTWAPDNSRVTAEAVCSHNSEHKITETAKVTSSVIKEATCTEKGETKYTAAFANEILTKQSKTVEDIAIDPDAHDWGEATYEWAADKSTCTATHVCKRDDSHVETETVDATSEVTKEATEDEEGVKTYTASFTNSAFEEQTTTEAIPKKDPDVKPTPTPAPTQAKTVLVAKGIASGKKAIKLSWNNVGADRYVIYMAKCNYKGKKYNYKAVKTVSGNTFKWTKKKLKKKTCYKFYVVAQKKTSSGYTTVATSNEGHAVTGNRRGKFTNPKSLTLKKSAITLSKGGSATIKGTVKKAKKGKKFLTTGHEPLYRYISNNPAVATVAANGKVTAKSSGTAVIYVQTINGIWKTLKVTVK